MKTPNRTDRSRTLILDAAAKAFHDHGFASTSMADIATRAGLTRKTVYNLFANKDEIAQHLIARIEAEPDPLYRARIAANEDVRVILEIILMDSAQWCLANPSLARVALDPATRPSLEPPKNRPSLQGLVRDVLVLGQSQGVVRCNEDANFMALVLLGIFGQAMLNAITDAQFDLNMIPRIIGIVFDGIGVPRP